VPVFGDQPANGQEAEIKGYGLSVSLVDLKADDLYNAIRYNNLLTMLDQWLIYGEFIKKLGRFTNA